MCDSGAGPSSRSNDPTVVNRLTKAVRRLCDAEKKMKALKTEFKNLKKEISSLAEILITDADKNTCPSTCPNAGLNEATPEIKPGILISNSANEAKEEQPTTAVAEESNSNALNLTVDKTVITNPNTADVTEEVPCKKLKLMDEKPTDVSENNPAPAPDDDKDYVEVFTSGDCEDNGKPWGRAGLGLFYGAGNPLNCSLPIEGARSTLNAASINACIQALRVGLENGMKKLKIFTNSEFTHNCITKWMDVWKENNWKTFKGGKVKFRKELERLDKLTSHFEGIKWILETEDIRVKEAEILAGIGVTKYAKMDYY